MVAFRRWSMVTTGGHTVMYHVYYPNSHVHTLLDREVEEDQPDNRLTWTPISHSVLHGSLMVRKEPDSSGIESVSFIALIKSALNSYSDKLEYHDKLEYIEPRMHLEQYDRSHRGHTLRY